MAKAKQIPNLINDILKESMGKKAPVLKDTSDLVSFAGKYNLADDNDLKDAIWNAIIDKVRVVEIYTRKFKGQHRKIRRNIGEWGAWYEELSYRIGEAVNNASWVNKQLSPFDVEDTGEVIARYFKALATWEHDAVWWDRKLLSAFNGVNKFNALMSALFESLDNIAEKELINVENLTLATGVAGVFKAGKSVQIRNPIKEYNDLTGEHVTVANCRFNPGFLAYTTSEISMTVDFLTKDFTTIYNVEKEPRHSPEDKLVVEVLSEFDKWLTYSMRPVYFNEKVIKMPNFSTVPYWQSGGESNSFSETSKISISNDTFVKAHVVEGAPDLNFTKSGIICVIRDENFAACCAERIKTTSVHNPRSECTNYFKKVEVGMGCNLSHNCVVFYLEDVEETPTVTSTETATE